MAEQTDADRYLLEQIAHGNTDAWSQLVNRYHGRLLAFARSRAGRGGDAEDLVQETFLLFLQSFKRFRPGASVETFLFTILRRRIIDQYRGRRVHACAIQESVDAGAQAIPSDEPTPSWYARRDEQADLIENLVAAALDALVRRFREGHRLTELRAIELLFYAQLRNKDVARLCAMEEGQVALLKFRALQEIRDHVAADLRTEQREALTQINLDDVSADSLLTRAWERRRPTCPKRSTIGRFLLKTLDDPWRDYVDFHLNQLGCRFCQANLEDLQRQSLTESSPARQRIFQSTIGFLTRT